MLDDFAERLRKLEAPSGEALNSTVAKLQSLITDIQAQLDAWAASRWTNPQITSQILTRIANAFAADVTFGGTITSPATFGTDLSALSGERRTMWMHVSGLFGYAPSTRERKVDVESADFDVDAILGIEPKTFRYREAVRRYEETPEEERVGPPPGLEVGFIAEELDEAGLGHFVLYDEKGKPEGIEYSMLVVAQQAAIRNLAARLDRLESGE